MMNILQLVHLDIVLLTNSLKKISVVYIIKPEKVNPKSKRYVICLSKVCSKSMFKKYVQKGSIVS